MRNRLANKTALALGSTAFGRNEDSSQQAAAQAHGIIFLLTAIGHSDPQNTRQRVSP
ncbi:MULTISPECIES: hypothetical protein [Burkholderia]|uniref:hypothetical protein n=1 Tax=Burkholderia TaxID=32008 RepID=UPI00158A305E|nr:MULTISPECIES: hypothetical protein [Burkholderia]